MQTMAVSKKNAYGIMAQYVFSGVLVFFRIGRITQHSVIATYTLKRCGAKTQIETQ
jgi:hypothetical protein